MIGLYQNNYVEQFVSPYETLMSVREKLLTYNFTSVDTLVEKNFNLIPADLVNSNINEGYSFINYRGYGHPNLWVGPQYTNEDILNLNNGYYLPFITSIVCGGGAFSSNIYPSCFGETWLTAGTPTTPKGAIGFIGPSEIDTKTWFNNPNDLGIYQGITQEEVKSCGEMLLRGKMEMYNNFPDCHEWGDAYNSDQFYFYTYNLLGDPGLKIWTDTPGDILLNYDNEIEENNSNFLEIEIKITSSDKENFIIAITDDNNNDSLIAVTKTDYNGIANIQVDFDIGIYSITASKTGYKPISETLTVISGDNLIISDLDIIGDPYPSENISITAQIKNPFSEVANCNYSLFSESEFITIPTINRDEFNILPNDSIEITIDNILVSNLWRNDLLVPIYLNIESNFSNQTNLLELILQSPELILNNLVVNNQSGALIQDDQNLLSVELSNIGNFETNEFNAIIECTNGNGEIISNNSLYQNIEQNDSGTNLVSFSVDIPENIITGLPLNLNLKILKDDTQISNINFSYPIGIINSYSPSIDYYGYVAIESRDSGSYEIPIYNWIELDNDLGGSGELLEPTIGYYDGMNVIYNLPFDFQFYGKTYSKITISTEGYISPGESERIFFRNKTIPSGNGPSGMIAPFWDNLSEGEIYASYDETLGTLIIEWSQFKSTNYINSDQTFQVIIYDKATHQTELGDNKILFQYKKY